VEQPGAARVDAANGIIYSVDAGAGHDAKDDHGSSMMRNVADVASTIIQAIN
jgi:hypothetical protein